MNNLNVNLDAIKVWRKSLYDAAGISADAENWLTQLTYSLEGEVFDTGIASDRKNRGSAINIQVTASDDVKKLAILQVRESVFHPRRYTKVRKDYFLIGYNENGSAFAHELTSMVTSRTTIDKALAKIWNCAMSDLNDIERQGDIAFVPVRKLPDDVTKLDQNTYVLRETHVLIGEIWKSSDETIYTRRGAKLKHTKGEHETIKAKAGLYRVQEGVRGTIWGHTTPTAD